MERVYRADARNAPALLMSAPLLRRVPCVYPEPKRKNSQYSVKLLMTGSELSLLYL